MYVNLQTAAASDVVRATHRAGDVVEQESINESYVE